MTFISADQRELFLPLIEGIHEDPPWQTFMSNLVARSHARRAFLIITLANAMPGQPPTVLHAAAPRAHGEPRIDLQRLTALRLHPYGQLRPGRVYGLDELLDFDDKQQLALQRAALSEMGIRYGRWLRISAGTADVWVVLVREREDFTAAASATLSNIGPHLAAALRAQVKLGEQALQARMAHWALEQIGVGMLAFDRDGRVMATDPQAEAMLPIADDPSGRPGRRLQLSPEKSRQLEKACAALSEGPSQKVEVIALDSRREHFLMLRPASLDLPTPSALPAVIGIVRQPHRPDPRRAIPAIAAMHGLSTNEAALAHGLATGETIVDTGARLHLTAETSRNYSKRIYAKVGASGQADLVRHLLEGLTPFA